MKSILYKGKNYKVETSSLKNLKIMPRNRNEFVLSWILSKLTNETVALLE